MGAKASAWCARSTCSSKAAGSWHHCAIQYVRSEFFLGVLHYRQRTSVEEHMIPQRVSHKAMRQMILASDKTDRQAALDKLLAMQREDITELFQ